MITINRFIYKCIENLTALGHVCVCVCDDNDNTAAVAITTITTTND